MATKIGEGVQIITTGCPHDCGGKCILKAWVKDEQIVAITTDDGEEPQLRACLRGRAYRQRVYASDRLKYPMRRTGERGEGQFERITWDEALDTVASEMLRIKKTYGPEAILSCTGPGSLSLLHSTGLWLNRLLGQFGGYTSRHGSMSNQGASDATRFTYGTGIAANEIEDLLNSRFIILWAWNSAEMVYGTNTTWVLTQAREKGIPITIVDPRYTDTAILAEEWIPIYPGTDSAMMVAMAYVMLKEGLHDQTFLDKYTIGFEKFRDYVTGKEDGISKTPHWAETITGVPASTIESLARRYATLKPAALLPGLGMQRTAYGEQCFRTAITLAAMTGNIGVSGGGPAGEWGTRIGLNAMPRVTNPLEKTIPTSKWAEAVLLGKAGGYPSDIKLIYVCGSNFFMQRPNINKGVEALKKVEFIVCHEQFLTPTARFADILIPVTTHLERNDICGIWGMGHSAIFCKQAIAPMDECKSDMEIFSELAPRIGITNYNDHSEDEWLKSLVENTEIDYKEFKQNGVHHFRHEPYIAFKAQISDPVHNPFRTPSGKIEIYSQRLADMNRPDTIPPIPKYIEPWEGRNDPLRVHYPLQLLTTHGKRTALSVYANIPWIQEVEPHAMWINPVDAKPREIQNGDWVRLFNERGTLMIKAKVTQRIMPGVVSIDHGMWYKPDELGVDWGGSVNVLTRDEDTPIGDGGTTHSCLVEAMKA
ncbi:MAG: molybdopterin-dependent oxidoreductase [Chloroflexi bacterium]|nr:molybdopterin-dependent oxidoreductase [Chloroflexota bacterium]